MNEEVGENKCFLIKNFFDQPSFAKENFSLLNQYEDQISEIQKEFPYHLQKSRSYSNFSTINCHLNAADPQAFVLKEKAKVDRELQILQNWIMEYPKMCTLKQDLSAFRSCYQDFEEMNTSQITEGKIFNIIRSLNITYNTLVNKYNNIENIKLFFLIRKVVFLFKYSMAILGRMTHYQLLMNLSKNNCISNRPAFLSRKSIIPGINFWHENKQPIKENNEPEETKSHNLIEYSEEFSILECCKRKIFHWNEIRRTYRNMEEPMMLCRICELRIPVRNEQRHTTACVQLNEKTKEIEQIDQSLLIIGNEITFSINLARKKMVENQRRSVDARWKEVMNKESQSGSHLRDLMTNLAMNKKRKSIRPMGLNSQLQSRVSNGDLFSPLANKRGSYMRVSKQTSTNYLQRMSVQSQSPEIFKLDIATEKPFFNKNWEKKLKRPVSYYDSRPIIQLEETKKLSQRSHFGESSKISLSNVPSRKQTSIQNLSSNISLNDSSEKTSGDNFSSEEETENVNMTPARMMTLKQPKEKIGFRTMETLNIRHRSVVNNPTLQNAAKNPASPMVKINFFREQYKASRPTPKISSGKGKEQKPQLSENSFDIDPADIDEISPWPMIPALRKIHTLAMVHFSNPSSQQNTPCMDSDSPNKTIPFGILNMFSKSKEKEEMNFLPKRQDECYKNKKAPRNSLPISPNLSCKEKKQKVKRNSICEKDLIIPEDITFVHQMKYENSYTKPKELKLATSIELELAKLDKIYEDDGEVTPHSSFRKGLTQPLSKINPEKEVEVLTQLRIIARGAYNISNFDPKSLDPFLDNIESIAERYSIDLFTNYCNNLRILLFKKQNIHLTLRSLNIRLSIHENKNLLNSPDFYSASPPTLKLNPAIRRMRSLGEDDDMEIAQIDLSFRRSKSRAVEDEDEKVENSLRSNSKNISSPSLSSQNTTQKLQKVNTYNTSVNSLPSLMTSYDKEGSLTQPIQARLNKMCFSYNTNDKSNFHMENSLQEEEFKDVNPKRSSNIVIENFKQEINLMEKVEKEEDKEYEQILEVEKEEEETPSISKQSMEMNFGDLAKMCEYQNNSNIRITPELVHKRKESLNVESMPSKVNNTSSMRDSDTEHLTNYNREYPYFHQLKDKGSEWVERFQKNKFRQTYRTLFESIGSPEQSKPRSTFLPTSKNKRNKSILTSPVINHFTDKLEEFQKNYELSIPIAPIPQTTVRPFVALSPSVSCSSGSSPHSPPMHNIYSPPPNTHLPDPIPSPAHSNTSMDIQTKPQSTIKARPSIIEDPIKYQMIKEFMNSLNEDPIIQDHTQSEVGFIQIEPYFDDLEIDPINCSNYLDQMTAKDREYFSECQDELVAQIKLIEQEYKRNKLFSTGRRLMRAQTIGVIRHEHDFDEFLVNPKFKIKKPTIRDFELLKPISHGAFGKVCLCRKIASGDIFAIKILDRHEVLAKSQEELIKAEKQVFEIVDNDFVIRGVYTFQSANYLYFVMEYMRGGDLGSLLENMGYLDEENAKMYLAELVLALGYLHAHKVIHRDLKPDNILIDDKGHTKLTDFGLSDIGVQKRANELMIATAPIASPTIDEYYEGGFMADFGRTDNFKMNSKNMKKVVGTPDYLAPELVKDGDHNEMVDWWAVGVIAYELMTGVRPFGAEQVQTVFENIINMNIVWPKIGNKEGEISIEAYDLMKRLLDPNPHTRLGSRGPEEVQKHSFFKEVKWSSIREDEPPFVPQIVDIMDMTYFNQTKLNFTTAQYLVDEPIRRQSISEIKGSAGVTEYSSFAQEESKILEDFDATMYPTLANINKQAAIKAQKAHEKQMTMTPCAKRRNFFDKEYSIQKLDLLKRVTIHNPILRERNKVNVKKTEAIHSLFRDMRSKGMHSKHSFSSEISSSDSSSSAAHSPTLPNLIQNQ